VQRYYKALPPTGQAKADWEIFRLVAETGLSGCLALKV
jgi:predicted molibdopterin-dependent oxidoreductase YjgC